MDTRVEEARATHSGGVRSTAAYFSGEYPVALNQPPGVKPSGLPNNPDGSMDAAGDAPYSVTGISDAPVDAALPAQSPIYQTPQAPVQLDDAQDMSYVSRLQPAIGFSGGAYALNTEVDAGAPRDAPDTALPGLRDGAYQFSQRLMTAGEQGVVDSLLRNGGSYLDVNPAPWLGADAG